MPDLIWKQSLSLDVWHISSVNCDTDPYRCFPPTAHMIIRFFAPSWMVGPCRQMQIKWLSQLLFPSCMFSLWKKKWVVTLKQPPRGELVPLYPQVSEPCSPFLLPFPLETGDQQLFMRRETHIRVELLEANIISAMYPVILLIGICPNKSISYPTDTFAAVFIVTLFTWLGSGNNRKDLRLVNR